MPGSAKNLLQCKADVFEKIEIHEYELMISVKHLDNIGIGHLIKDVGAGRESIFYKVTPEQLTRLGQRFARGQNFTYSLTDLGRYYYDYVALMSHFDRVLSGRVHRVIYEQLIADPEEEVRRLLSYCGVPFEDSCLRYYETDRAVRTASSEQVRMPIFKDAVDQWRHFEPWLEPLKTALGPALTAYPDAPAL